MNKQITVDSELPHYLYSEQINGKVRNVVKIYDLLNQNIIARDLDDNYQRLVAQSFDKIEEESNIVNEIKFNITELIRNRSEPFKVHGEFSELKLCNSTSDKIFFSPLLKAEEVYLQSEVYRSIKFCTIQSLDDICPVLPFKIQLLPGQVYNLQELISKVSSKSKTLKIIDPYIYNKHAIFNLTTITETRFFSEITIKTNPIDKKTGNPKTKNSKSNPTLLNELVKKLVKNGSKVKLENFSRGEHQQRYILFDDVQIEVPGGLDFLDPQGRYSATKEIGYLRFEEREF